MKRELWLEYVLVGVLLIVVAAFVATGYGVSLPRFRGHFIL